MDRRVVFGVAVALVAVLVAGAIGTTSYRAGVAQGLADAGKLPAPAAGWPPAAYWHYRPFWHHGPFGFVFPLLFGLLFALLLLGVLRRVLWGGWCGGMRHGDGAGVPPMFEEWHRRSHAPPPGPGPAA
jgi:hypothetical protein